MLLLFSAGGIVFGNSFDYSGFLPNYIECAGNDPGGVFIAWVNTIAWAGGYVRSPAALRCFASAALRLRHRPCAARSRRQHHGSADRGSARVCPRSSAARNGGDQPHRRPRWHPQLGNHVDGARNPPRAGHRRLLGLGFGDPHHTSETWAAPFQTVENICAGQVRPAMEHLAERG